MAKVSSASSVLPWIWMIETLASAKQVDASFISDVIEMAPQLHCDLGKDMVEMVALRCLEGLYGSGDGSSDCVSLKLDSSIRVGPSESCESVLRFISSKTPSNLKVLGAEQSKLDIHSFIMHKRASMPKCTLQQLKDSILEGTHEYAASLKDISGLACKNECERIPSNDGGHNAVTQSNGENRNSISQTFEVWHKLLQKVPQMMANAGRIQKEDFDSRNEKFVTDNDSNKRRKKNDRVHPQIRRTRIPFTAEEEEMIREGVSRFSDSSERWVAILDFGADVFQKGRRSGDLKDKWRNMCKVRPPRAMRIIR